MRKDFIFMIFFLVAAVTSAQVPGLEWARGFGGANLDTSSSLAVDAAGNVYTTGYFQETVDFDPGPGVFELTANDYDGYVTKFNANGDFVWAKQFGGAEFDAGTSIAVDASGNVVVAGYFSDVVDFDPGPATSEHTAVGGIDIVVFKLSSAGTLEWVKQMGGTGSDYPAAVVTGPAGVIYLTGGFEDVVVFDPATPSSSRSSDGKTDAFVVKLEADGSFGWVQVTGDSEDDWGKSLTVLPGGNVGVAGETGDPDGGGEFSIFVRTHNELNGSTLVSRSFGGTDANEIHSIRSDAGGNIYLAGSFRGTIDFDIFGPGFPMTAAGSDTYVCKLDPAGVFVWSLQLGFPDTSDNSNSMAVDINGNIFLTGTFYETVDIDPGPGVYNIETTFSDDPGMFILKLDNSGNFVWAYSTTAVNLEGGYYITTDNGGNIYALGTFADMVDFGVCAEESLTSAGGEDVFVLKFNPSSPVCFDIVEQPVATVVACYGSETHLSTLAYGTTRITYQWQKFNGSVFVDIDDNEGDEEDGFEGYDGTDRRQLTIYPITSGGTGQFRCRINGDFITETFTNITTVTYAPSPSIPHVVANSGCGSGQYMITAYGGTDGEYRWYESGALIDGAVNGTYTTDIISVSTLYSVSRTTGTCESEQARVMVRTTDCSPTPGLVWANQSGTTSGLVTPSGMVLDGAGNIYTVGRFSGTADFDPGPGTSTLTAPAGDLMNFLSKVNASGILQWVISLGDVDSAPSIAYSTTGHIYLAGGFNGTVDFDPGTGTASRTSMSTLLGPSDIYLTKFDVDGNFVWVKTMGGASATARARSVAADASGNAFITGSFRGPIDFDPDTGVMPGSTSGTSVDTDLFVAKYSAAGFAQWAHDIGGNFAESGRSIKVDGSGNVYATGTMQSTSNMDFNPAPGTGPANVFNLVSSGGTDFYVHKFDNAGLFQWAVKVGGPGVEQSIDLALDASGNPHIAGVFGTSSLGRTLDFDPGTGITELTAGGIIFVLKLTTGGAFTWARNFGVTFGSQPAGIAVGATGNVLVTGFSAGGNDLDPGSAIYSIPTAVAADAFISELNASGNFSWAFNMGSTGLSHANTYGTVIATDAAGNIYTTGEFAHSSDFDPGHCTYMLAAQGSTTMFLQKIRPGVAAMCFNIQPVAATGCVGTPLALYAVGAGTTNITYQWQKLNAMTTLFEDLAEGGGYTGTGTEELIIDTNGGFGAGSYQCKITGDNAPDKNSNAVAVIVNATPPPPTSPGSTSCSPGPQTLTASGSTDGNYRWYDDAVGSPIAGEVNGTFVTPFITGSTTYYVSAVSGTCESTLTPLDAEVNLTVAAPGATDAVSCTTPATLTLTASGAVDGQYRWYDTETGLTPIAGQTNSTFLTPSLTSSVNYFVAINDGSCESERTLVTASVAALPPSPTATGATMCTSSAATLTAAGAADGEYRWYNSSTGGTSIPGEVNASYTTPTLSSTTDYFVSIHDGNCESVRTMVTATIQAAPSSPSVTGGSSCGPGVVTLTASGGSNGDYRWYTEATGGSSIPGEQNGTYTTPSISTTTNYYVSIQNGCESARQSVVATINNVPLAPSTTGATRCGAGTVTLNASGGTDGQYRWYTLAAGGSAISGETTGEFITPSLSATTTYYVAINNGSCEGVRTGVTATINTCPANQPPVISAVSGTVDVRGSTTINLTPLINDPDNNLDLASLRIVVQPSSGAVASIDAGGNLIVDYSGVSFAGPDQLTIEICDTSGSCVQRIVNIEVIGGITIFNAVSPNGDGKNDVLFLQYIELLDETRENKVTIFNRWGDQVFDVENYNNTTRVFDGTASGGRELPSGTYYYKIEFRSGRESLTGYLTLRR